MRIRITTRVDFFVLPTIQAGRTSEFLGVRWPWYIILWWGYYGIQLCGRDRNP